MSFIYHFFQDYSLSILGITIVVLIVSNVFLPLTYRALVQVIGLMIVVACVYMKGAKDERSTWELDKKNLELIAQTEKTQREKISTDIAVLSAKNRELIIQNGTLKDINVYISKEDSSKCPIPAGFVRLHNESAKGRLSGTTK